MNVKRLIDYVLGLPKTLYINFKYFSFKDALKLPVLISHKVKLIKVKGRIIIEGTIKTGMIKIGYDTIDIFDSRNLNSIWKNEGTLRFKGDAVLKNGVKINIGKKGELIFGKNILINNNTAIICNNKISFGDNNLISWDCLFMDTDFHGIFDQSKQKINLDKEIKINNNVWIGCRCTILKGTFIENNNVIAANTVLSGKLNKDGNIYGGSPVRVIKENIIWTM